ncbi:GNAT family N-acetyltransferase [Paenibacillus pinistramenti]|uniref:GNAT family N-acetyltransferase n=1 Tax=Paenibacillus pinistramenti TaxID=1768003 RepID=UPI001396B365|nr:GNAT family N-acetyltransferase [Paenibacillus pinistramenti]
MTSLMRQLSYPTTLNVMKERLTMMDKQSSQFSYVAELDGEVVGTVGLEVVRKQDMEKPVMFITSLIVDKRFRKMGLGKRLVDKVEEMASDLSCSHMHVGYKAERGPGPAKDFYLKQGFECTGYRLSKPL